LNIVDAFLFQARHQPTELALCVPGTHYSAVSYGRLRLFVNNIASRALSAGLARGNVVAVVTNDPRFHLAIVLGLTRIGAVTLSATSLKLPGELKVDAILTDAPGMFQNAPRRRKSFLFRGFLLSALARSRLAIGSASPVTRIL
jgi:acyl-coenzyme A synthetase/AMP-(fatty) acid ligase